MENYFNYFTEIEECFRRCRGTPTLLSTLDWALIESWKDAGIPLDAVRAGIERAFQKFAQRKPRFQKVNSLAYCVQTVFEAAEEWKAVPPAAEYRTPREQARPPFAAEEVSRYLEQNLEALARAAARAKEGGAEVLAADLRDAEAVLRRLANSGDLLADLEALEQQLSAMEDKLTASLTRAASVERLASIDAEFNRSLARHRHTLTAEQIETLRRQYVKKVLFDAHGVPRLSLFYL
jgi:DNA primase